MNKYFIYFPNKSMYLRKSGIKHEANLIEKYLEDS